MAHALTTGDYVCNVDADNFVGFGFTEYLRAVFTRRPNAILTSNRVDRRTSRSTRDPWVGWLCPKRTSSPSAA